MTPGRDRCSRGKCLLGDVALCVAVTGPFGRTRKDRCMVCLRHVHAEERVLVSSGDFEL